MLRSLHPLQIPAAIFLFPVVFFLSEKIP